MEKPKTECHETYILPFSMSVFAVFSFAQKAGESRQLTRQDSLRLQQLLNGQVEIVIDDETQQEIDRLFNPEKWKMKSTPFPKRI